MNKIKKVIIVIMLLIVSYVLVSSMPVKAGWQDARIRRAERAILRGEVNCCNGDKTAYDKLLSDAHAGLFTEKYDKDGKPYLSYSSPAATFPPNGISIDSIYHQYWGNWVQDPASGKLVWVWSAPESGHTGALISSAEFSGFYRLPNGNYYPIGIPIRGSPPRDASGNPITGFPTFPPITPTPTVVPRPWIRLKDSSFVSDDRIESLIPNNPDPFDADDTNDTYYIVGDGGIVLSPDVFINGLNPSAKPNAKDWKASYYLPSFYNTSKTFNAYIKGRKSYKTITSLDQINSDGIYLYNGGTNALDFDSVPSSFNQYNIVLISDVAVNIATDGGFMPQKSVAILADRINFKTTVTEAKAIFLAESIITGNTENLGLKIIGNLIANTTFDNQRKWSNLNRPALFIVFRPDMYLDLLPYLSIANYEWQQQQ